MAEQSTDNTKQRVAFDLMKVIADKESGTKPAEANKGREYWLSLYGQCLKVVQGVPVGTSRE